MGSTGGRNLISQPRPSETLLISVLVALICGHVFIACSVEWQDVRDSKAVRFWLDKSERLVLGQSRSGNSALPLCVGIVFDLLVWIGPTIVLALAAYCFVGRHV